mmetsp:Transcript_31948/g.67998  ORF Transcript_31948/g.67998 Transcript_31948/m.67998 type:complete len:262 (+) Transcript_31948:224-1009(+)
MHRRVWALGPQTLPGCSERCCCRSRLRYIGGLFVDSPLHREHFHRGHRRARSRNDRQWLFWRHGCCRNCEICLRRRGHLNWDLSDAAGTATLQSTRWLLNRRRWGKLLDRRALLHRSSLLNAWALLSTTPAHPLNPGSATPLRTCSDPLTVLGHKHHRTFLGVKEGGCFGLAIAANLRCRPKWPALLATRVCIELANQAYLRPFTGRVICTHPIPCQRFRMPPLLRDLLDVKLGSALAQHHSGASAHGHVLHFRELCYISL